MPSPADFQARKPDALEDRREYDPSDLDRRATMSGDDDSPRYDRDFLLSPGKRNQVIELWEVEKFGRDSFGDPDAVSLYGMTPTQWYARGVRILARRGTVLWPLSRQQSLTAQSDRGPTL